VSVRHRSKAKRSPEQLADEKRPGEVLDEAIAPEEKIPLEPRAAPQVSPDPGEQSLSKPADKKPVSSEPTLIERYGI
jgi:hypothetical protein